MSRRRYSDPTALDTSGVSEEYHFQDALSFWKRKEKEIPAADKTVHAPKTPRECGIKPGIVESTRKRFSKSFHTEEYQNYLEYASFVMVNMKVAVMLKTRKMNVAMEMEMEMGDDGDGRRWRWRWRWR